jgi:hypothetical protein
MRQLVIRARRWEDDIEMDLKRSSVRSHGQG